MVAWTYDCMHTIQGLNEKWNEFLVKKQNFEGLLRKSFKSYTGLKKTVENKSVEDLMGYNIQERSRHLQHISEQKWYAREEGKIYDPFADPNKELAFPPKPKNICKYMPKLMVKYVNIQTILCPRCKEIGIISRCTRAHLGASHNVEIESVDCIAKNLGELAEKQKKKQRNKETRTKTKTK